LLIGYGTGFVAAYCLYKHLDSTVAGLIGVALTTAGAFVIKTKPAENNSPLAQMNDQRADQEGGESSIILLQFAFIPLFIVAVLTLFAGFALFLMLADLASWAYNLKLGK
jgi:hypothetical protein